MEGEEHVSPTIGTLRHSVDVEALLEKFLRLRKVTAPLDSGTPVSNDASNNLVVKLLISVIDHILFNNQFTSEPNFIAQAMQHPRSSSDWVEEFVEEKGMAKRQKRPFIKFINSWTNVLDGIQDVLKEAMVPSIFVCLGRSLQRLSKVYQLSFRNFGNENLTRSLASLSFAQQNEFSSTVGRLLVRGLLQVNERANHEFSRPLNHRHDRIFICLQAIATDYALSSIPYLFESFRTEAIDSFHPLPKVPRRRKVRKPKEVNHSDEVESAPSEASGPTDESLRCIVVNFEPVEDQNGEETFTNNDQVWIVPVRGIKNPT